MTSKFRNATSTFACVRVVFGEASFFPHQLASWHRRIEWISDGNGDTIENSQNPPSDGVLFSVDPDAFQMDRTFVHETRSTLTSARPAPPMEPHLVSCRSVRWSFPCGSRTQRSPLFPSDSIELRQDFPVRTRVRFLSTGRFHGILSDLDPNGKLGLGQHPIWGSSAPTGLRSPFFGGMARSTWHPSTWPEEENHRDWKIGHEGRVCHHVLAALDEERTAVPINAASTTSLPHENRKEEVCRLVGSAGRRNEANSVGNGNNTAPGIRPEDHRIKQKPRAREWRIDFGEKTSRRPGNELKAFKDRSVEVVKHFIDRGRCRVAARNPIGAPCRTFERCSRRAERFAYDIARLSFRKLLESESIGRLPSTGNATFHLQRRWAIP